ncbi:MAG: hypothetical protein F4Y47_06005 [Acidobacteriia bacterium]|nr:hypothetical protein [Terriglobia bacterium]MYG01814.1 hypothetical protein [Terriglobia bacterium]MYK08446.1 hypothetical protein [Terriglobia bacterium]
MPDPKVTQFPEQSFANGGGNGSKFDDRLRAVENRLTAIETMMENAATKTDIAGLKVWALGGALVGALAVLGWLVYWILRNIPLNH